MTCTRSAIVGTVAVVLLPVVAQTHGSLEQAVVVVPLLDVLVEVLPSDDTPPQPASGVAPRATSVRSTERR